VAPPRHHLPNLPRTNRRIQENWPVAQSAAACIEWLLGRIPSAIDGVSAENQYAGTSNPNRPHRRLEAQRHYASDFSSIRSSLRKRRDFETMPQFWGARPVLQMADTIIGVRLPANLSTNMSMRLPSSLHVTEPSLAFGADRMRKFFDFPGVAGRFHVG
jgi:hypothetical protein